MDSTSDFYTFKNIPCDEMTNASFEKRFSKVSNKSSRVFLNFVFFTAASIVRKAATVCYKTFVNSVKP